ncbi:hypothetical protein [Hymenobacter convexus]|uniref:hypothetical protein n=1 Tax=Hymenobacter sp. CA1UV-4 TaxID=3063782 RepID=UPI002712B313|nr:hypothetical protein [Hymenobacter sp. CA1UV-4]MDO7852003.1 hypothetical protein [Hymenobacter sp. CA1UV-4]
MEPLTPSAVAPPHPTAIAQALARGVTYLEQHQYPNGEFCSYFAPDDAIQGWCLPDSAVFPAALVAGCLLWLPLTPQVDGILTRATTFFEHQMNHGGLWNHFTTLHRWRHTCPLDVDDTACVSAILRARGVACPRPSNVPLLLANRNKQGLFYSWFLLRLRWNRNRTYWRVTLPELLRPVQSLLFWFNVEASRNDVDGVVNANALYYLGPGPETQPIVDFLLRIIAEKREADCDLWYRDAHFVYYFFTRAYHSGVPALEPLRQPIIDRILARARPDGRLGDTLADTAWAACSLLNLGSYPPELTAAINYLLKKQEAAGNWPRWLLYYGGPKKRMGWGSEEMTTGFCLEALARYQASLLTT